MAENIKITFEIDGIQQSVSSVEELQNALKGVDTQAKKTEKQLDDTADAAKNVGDEAKNAGEAGEGAMKVMDEATGGLATKVKEVGGGLKAMGKQAVTAFKGAVQGASAMGKALIATGIGAIVVALGLIVAYWDDIVGAVSGVSSEQKQLLADTEAEVAARQSALDATMASENSLRLAGKSEKEIRDLKIQQTQETINAMEAQLILQREQTEAQVKAQKRNQEIAQAVIRFLTAPLTLLLATVDGITAAVSKIPGIDIATNLEEGFSGGLAGLLFDPEETAAQGAADIAEAEAQLAKLKNTRDGFILAGQKEEADASAKRVADAEAEAKRLADIEKQRLADQAAAAAKYAADQQVINDALQKARLDSIEDAFEHARAELAIQEQLEIDKLKAAGATQAQIAEIQQSYSNKRKRVDEDEAQYYADLQELKKEASLAVASAALGAIVELVGEGSAIGKAAAIAQTTIDTYQSATAAYKSVVGIPVVGPVLAPIAAGVAVASGIASVKKIIATKTPGEDVGGSVPSAAGIIPSGPAIDPTAALQAASSGQTGDNQITLGQQQGSSGATIVKAYVVSSDMTSQQEADKKINDLARL